MNLLENPTSIDSALNTLGNECKNIYANLETCKSKLLIYKYLFFISLIIGLVSLGAHIYKFYHSKTNKSIA